MKSGVHDQLVLGNTRFISGTESKENYRKKLSSCAITRDNYTQGQLKINLPSSKVHKTKIYEDDQVSGAYPLPTAILIRAP